SDRGRCRHGRPTCAGDRPGRSGGFYASCSDKPRSPAGHETPASAVRELRTCRVVGKSKERQRRVCGNEEQAWLQHFAVRDIRAEIPMADIIRFALLTARRQEEITGIK
ncbi:hypothetical protein AB4084_27790, partial [Lysobacter sp. 2RAB21]